MVQFLRLLDERLKAHQTAAVALKGIALHDLGLYQPGDRPMADLDLLVSLDNLPSAARALESMGLRETITTYKDRTFEPVVRQNPASLGEHAENDLKIELHHQVSERLPLRVIDLSSRLQPRTTEGAGIQAYPSKASLMLHLLLHAAGNMTTRSLRLLQLYDIALLSRCMTPADWEQTLRDLPADQPSRWAWPPLQLTARYFTLDLPSAVRALRHQCPALLIHLTRKRLVSDVSFSYPAIEAFPGLEWSSSVTEMATLVLSRIKPSKEMLAARATLSRMHPWASDAGWSAASQPRRISRWLFNRPVRPVTLHAIRAALGQAP